MQNNEILVHISQQVKARLQNGERIVLGIDGSCGSGKTTLANGLQKAFAANVISCDSFFLPAELRNGERLEIHGANLHFERLKEQVIKPVLAGLDFYYKPFDCKTMSYKDEIFVQHNDFTIIEGSYSLQAELINSYNMKIFLNIAPDLQLLRLKNRNSETLQDFVQRWIPLENKYFHHQEIDKKCDFVYQVTE